MIAKARTVGSKGGGALLSYVLGESPGKDPEKIELLMKRNVPEWCMWAENFHDMFSIDRMDCDTKCKNNQIDIIISPDSDHTVNWNDEFWDELKRTLPSEFAQAESENNPNVMVSKEAFGKLSPAQKSVVWHDKEPGVYYLKRNWRDNWTKVAEDFIDEMDRPREEKIKISRQTFIKLNSKSRKDVISENDEYYRKRRYEELKLRKAKSVAALHHDAASGIGHVHIEASRIADGKVMDDHYLGVRAKIAADALCHKYGWQTATEKSNAIKSDIRNLAIDFLRKEDKFDFDFVNGTIIGTGWSNFKNFMMKNGWELVETYGENDKIQGYTIKNIDQPYRNYKASAIAPGLTLDKLATYQPKIRAEFLHNREYLGKKCVEILSNLERYDSNDYINKLIDAYGASAVNYKRDNNGNIVSYSIIYGGRKYASSDLYNRETGSRSLTPSQLANTWSSTRLQAILANGSKSASKQEKQPKSLTEPMSQSEANAWLKQSQQQDERIMKSIPADMNTAMQEWRNAEAEDLMLKPGEHKLTLSASNGAMLRFHVDVTTNNYILEVHHNKQIRKNAYPANTPLSNIIARIEQPNNPIRKSENNSFTSDKSMGRIKGLTEQEIKDMARMLDKELMQSLSPALRKSMNEWRLAGAKKYMPKPGVHNIILPIGPSLVLKFHLEATGESTLEITNGSKPRVMPYPTNMHLNDIIRMAIRELLREKQIAESHIKDTIIAANEKILSIWGKPMEGYEKRIIPYGENEYDIYLPQDVSDEFENLTNNEQAYASPQDHNAAITDSLFGFLGLIMSAQSAALAVGSGGGGGDTGGWRDRRDDEDNASWARYCIGQASIGRLAPPGGRSGGRSGRGGFRR